jgi:hypothetical protein
MASVSHTFVPDTSTAFAALGAALARRSGLGSAPSYVPPLPDASLVVRRAIPPIDTSAPSLQDVLHDFVGTLGEPYAARLRPEFFASPVSLDQAELRLGGWLIAGLACEVGVFNDDPKAGWDFVAELLIAIDEPSGTCRFYVATHVFDTNEFQATLFSVARERVAMLSLFGTD